MSLKTIWDGGVFSKLLYTVAASAVVGGGTVVLNNQARIAVLESTSAIGEHRLERIEDKIDILLQQGVDTKNDRDSHPRR
jgi:hypothetical protein